MTFEKGKQYRYDPAGQTTYTCLFANDDVAFFKTEGESGSRGHTWMGQASAHGYAEYIPDDAFPIGTVLTTVSGPSRGNGFAVKMGPKDWTILHIGQARKNQPIERVKQFFSGLEVATRM